MKQILFIFFLILFSINVFSQNERYYKHVKLTLYNSEMKTIENATVSVDGKIIPYDSLRQIYLLFDSISKNFNVEVSCDGYESISYSQENLHNYGTDSDFSSFIYLKRPTENYYYASDYWLKIPYQSYPNQLLVILNSKGRPIDDSLRFQLESKIQQKGLKINPDFPKSPSNFEEEMALMSIAGLESRVIIEKEDGSNFDSDYCEELAFLRSLYEVEGAGPLIIRSDQYNIATYDHKIRLYQSSGNYFSKIKKEQSQEINRLVKQVDERYYFDEKTQEIILPPEINEIVPEIMEKLRDIGIKEKMMMLMYYMVSYG